MVKFQAPNPKPHTAQENLRLPPVPARGFTLVETIVALALIITAAMGPMTLAARGIFNAKFSKSKLIALNLAQEGAEIIRHMRDNNVLAGFDWRGSVGPCPANCTRLPDGSYQPDVFTIASGSTPPLDAGVPLRFDTTSGLYSQSFGSPTLFTRMITISTPALDQMRVRTRITWTESSLPRQVELTEVLYNWR